MLKNSKMQEVAQLLGVELGEKFRTKNTHNSAIWWIDERGLHGTRSKFGDAVNYDFCRLEMADLLMGADEIRKMPWRSHKGDEFWYVAWTGAGYILIQSAAWGDNFMDYLLLRSRNCFRTKAEATKKQYDVYKNYMGHDHPDIVKLAKVNNNEMSIM